MRPLLLSVLVASLLAVPAARAQSPTSRWSLELTAGGALPTSTLGGSNLATGFGVGANVRFRLQNHLATYAGWEYHHFSSDQLQATQTLDVEETGYTVGLRFEHPFRGEVLTPRTPAYWLRGGALYDHLEVENDDGDLIGDTGHGLGWEVGAGVTLPLGDRVALTPGLRYRTLRRDLPVAGTTRAVTLSYVALGAGLVLRF